MVTATAPTAAAFGKSLVRNEKFSWRIVATDHFDVYYYEEEAFLVAWAADVAERAYDQLADDLGFDLERRIPIILYMSARHFEQNNISPISGEGVGGFSEPLKRRLVIPYNGSQRQFEETMVHEMTHIFQFELLFPTFGAAFTGISPPTWFMEGLAEHEAEDWNPEGEMVLRDAVMTENVPDLKYLQDFRYLPAPYLGYKLGQSALDYIAETYGDDAPAKLLKAFENTTLRRPDDALEDAFDIKLDDLSEDWKVWLKQRYWPLIGEKAQLKDFATQLSPVKDRRDYISYFKPKWSPSGDLVACLTVKDRFLDIFLVNAETGEKFENLTKGYALSKYEYLMYLENGLSWSPDGNFIAFVGKKATYDQIFILNVLNRKIVRRYNPKFEDILSPAYSPDGRYITFVGVAKDRRDIYVLDVVSGLRKVTDDFYDDGYPSWSPDGEYIYYASERQTFHNIFRVRPDGSGAEQVTFGDNEDISPVVSPDGRRLMFVSNRADGIFNIFVMDLATREVGQYTDVVTGVMDAAWNPEGDAIAFTAFEDMTYAIWTMPWQDEPVGPKVVERPEPGDYGYATWLAEHGGEAGVEAPESEPTAGVGEGALTAAAEGESPALGEPAVTGEVLARALAAEEEKATAGEVGEAGAAAEGGEAAAGAAEASAGEEGGAAGEEGEATNGGESSNGGEASKGLEPATVRDLVVSDIVDESRKYGIKFGPDYLYTTFAYTTGGVFTNYTLFGISDILGSHRVDFLFDLTNIGSLQDIDAEIDYYYFTRRTSYVFSGMSWQDYYVAAGTAFDRRLSGGSVVASYPLNMRNRVDFGLYGYDRHQRYYWRVDETPIPSLNDNMVGAFAGLTRDTSQWEVRYHPTAGSRISYTVRQTAPVSASSLYYTEQVLDLRRYIRLSRRVSLAFRAVGGADLGRDSQDFFLGGGNTLRGYDYYELYGSRFGLGSFEFRFPLLDYLVWPIEGFAIGGFRGLFFADLGSAWGKYDNGSVYPDDWRWYTDKEDQKYDRFTFATSEGGWHLVHGKMAFGTGIRWWFGYFDLKFDWAWRTNLRGVETPPRFHFTIGPDF